MPEQVSKKAPKNDRALRFYRDVLGLERLHYGMWEPGEPLTIEYLKGAQKRYEDFLISNIPEGTKRILDVGCGTGELCLHLKNAGFEVEGLSPDQNQEIAFRQKVDSPFHFTRFEEARFDSLFDCLIMSESCQYIPLQLIFPVAASALKPGGHLMVCDYFVTDRNAGLLSKSGHNHAEFLAQVETHGFTIIKQEDITAKILNTLVMADELARRSILGLQILSEKFRTRNPLITRLILWLGRKKIRKVEEQLVLLDAEKFAAAKRYEFFLMRYEPET